MVFNLFSKSAPIDAKFGFAHKINTDVYSDAQDLIMRHIKMIYAELNEDLKKGSRGTESQPLSMPFPCLSEPDPLHYEPRQQSSIYTHQGPHAQPQPQPQPQHSDIHPPTGHWDPAFPDAWVPEIRVKSQSGYLDDCDGQDFVKDGGHPRGHIGLALQGLDILGTTTLSPSEGLPDVAQEATPRVERERAQSAAQRDATRKTPEPRPYKALPLVPSGTRANANSRLVDEFTREQPSGSRPQQESSQSGNQADEKTRRISEPSPHDGMHDFTSPDNLNQAISVDNLTLKEVMIRILHWIEACQKRLKGFPGETIANFRRALDAIPPEIKLEERYLPQLIKLARRLERFYWRIMRHEDFEYIRSACDGAQQRVEAWSKNLRSPPSERHVEDGAGDPAIREIRES